MPSQKQKKLSAEIFCIFECLLTQNHTYQISCIMRETHATVLFLTLTRIIKLFSCISHCVAFRVNINNKIKRTLFVSMHFRFKLDINANFPMQNDDWVFICAIFQLSSHLTPKDLSLIICSWRTLPECATPVWHIEKVQLSHTPRFNIMYQNKQNYLM